MSFESLLNQAVVIQNRASGSSEDEMGNEEIADSGSPIVTKGRIWRRREQPQEVTIGRDTAVSDWVLDLMPDVDIDHRAIVTEGGRTFEVLGSPYPVQGSANTHHLQVALRLVVE